MQIYTLCELIWLIEFIQWFQSAEIQTLLMLYLFYLFLFCFFVPVYLLLFVESLLTAFINVYPVIMIDKKWNHDCLQQWRKLNIPAMTKT